MKRALNILKRAVEDFNFSFKYEQTIEDVIDDAINCIQDNIDFDYVDFCEVSNHYQHYSWDDGCGYSIEMSGQLISPDDRANKYFRYNFETNKYEQIPWYKHTDDDYIAIDLVVNTFGKVALLLSR